MTNYTSGAGADPSAKEQDVDTVANIGDTFPEADMQQTTIAIAGMTCGGCVSAVQKALRAVPGARVDEVTVGSATVSYDASRTNSAALAQAIHDAGYRPLTAALPVAAGAADPAGGCCGGNSNGGGSCCG